MRAEMVRVVDQAAVIHAEFGVDGLRERHQCVVRAEWTERALGRAEDGVGRASALIAELGALKGPDAEELLRAAEEVRARL
ncbi:hypothetical protein ACIBL5_13240 [Streptomyces sp. NPDC050516]|uniref:hypothetical protein n=1 Tax=Streptomyces sp. NPDC050516 TaxID=3365621 RepID=UPI0037BDFDB0